MLVIFGLPSSLFSQNLGVGTTNPQSTLDVRGNHRLGGMSKFITFDSVSGKITWSGSNLFVPVSQYIMQHSASSEGLYYGGGQLEYRNQIGSPAFFTNWINGNGYFANNLGIRNSSPAFPLSFDTGLGDKISLWSNSTNSYGFGIQGSLLQIHTDISAADIGFGYGSSSTFFETMRIKGNGSVGIGNNAPYSPLSFGNSFGEKLSLYGNAANNYGFGVLNGLLQIHSNNIGSDIGIGSGSSASFAEVMRIKGAGYVGIGTTVTRGKLSIESPDGISFPQLSLHQTSTGDYSRARFTNGNSAGTGRYWDIASFIDPFINWNDRLAFYNNAAGDVLALGGNGAIYFSGSAGNPGQVLQSNGPSTAPVWTTPSTPKIEYYQFIIPNTTLTDASSSVQFNLPANVLVNSIITVSVTVNVTSTFFIGCNFSKLIIGLEPLGGGGLVGTAGTYNIPCGQTDHTFSTGEIPLLASNGTMKIFGPGSAGAIIRFVKSGSGTPDITIGSRSPAIMIVKVIPQ